ncbi:MAG: metal-dependent transcriptional regulator [Ignavibacteriales bacterium]|nr:metal-dependent transcriptional regulator [Ignavibacteriales bacterium]MBI3787670.1 metal-dependent transcriptional regulator [Ignavibacteriales bacterium]
MASEQVENYLKNIYKLQSAEGKVTTSSLSERLQISAPSVTEMIKKLAEEGSVTYTPYKGVELTDAGRKRALRIIRRHRLWELFLVEVLKFPWDEIDEEAERLEHITSEKLEQRLDEALGYPRRDPHGDAIPTIEGAVEHLNHASLAEAKPGVTLVVARVSDSSPEILQYAAKMGIKLKRKIKVKERMEFDGSLRVEVGKKEQFISSKLAKNIFVETIS